MIYCSSTQVLNIQAKLLITKINIGFTLLNKDLISGFFKKQKSVKISGE